MAAFMAFAWPLRHETLNLISVLEIIMCFCAYPIRVAFRCFCANKQGCHSLRKNSDKSRSNLITSSIFLFPHVSACAYADKHCVPKRAANRKFAEKSKNREFRGAKQKFVAGSPQSITYIRVSKVPEQFSIFPRQDCFAKVFLNRQHLRF